MANKKVIILLPKIGNSGPSKGALALSKGICDQYSVTVFSLEEKKSKEKNSYKNTQVVFLKSFFNIKILKYLSFFSKIKNLKKKYDKIVVISFTLIPDIFVSLLPNDIKKISSIRMNIFRDYKYLFGYFYFFIVKLHVYALSRFNVVVTMHDKMKNQFPINLKRKIVNISNFIDEESLSKYRKNKISSKEIIKIVYCGSLIKRKDPIALIYAIKKIKSMSRKVSLDLIGSGPLLRHLKFLVNKFDLNQEVFFHGHLKNPYKIMSNNDLFVLPSQTEGVSRAMLEALYLGLYCIVRNIDGNSDIIKDKKNGYLFENNNELFNKILKAEKLKNSKITSKNELLPTHSKYDKNIQRYLDLINEI
jgi:glycosyltransferase involved in cell wall biosynthesis